MLVLTADEEFMSCALQQARNGAGQTHPNPSVGAVIVQGDIIVGFGWTQPGGRPHAEVVALEMAGDKARGATLYVTLEPCSHTHNRDGSPRLSCARRCIEAGIVRVVCATEDPDPRVSGQGFHLLREAGIELTVGVMGDVVRGDDPAYFYHRSTGLPYITHKAAMTLDGKIAAPGGHSRWVTGPLAREQVHWMRDKTDALIVGVGTVLVDDPSLTTRLGREQIEQRGRNGRTPLTVIIDSRLRTPHTAKVARAGALFCTTEQATQEKRTQLTDTGAEVRVFPTDADGRVSVADVARSLGEMGIVAALLESGGELAAAFYRERLVQQVVYFVAPKIIGGADAPTPVGGPGISRDMGAALRLKGFRVEQLTDNGDLIISGEVVYDG